MNALYVLVFLFCFLLTRAVAQENKPVAPISAEEETEILVAQKQSLQAKQNIDTAKQLAVEADQKLQGLAAKIYSSRKVTGAEYSLCDGPQLQECSDVKPGRIALRPVPKKKTEAQASSSGNNSPNVVNNQGKVEIKKK